MTTRIGSLCTGYGGLDTAVQRVFGGRLAWVSDIDPGARQILAHHHPEVPNLGDLTTTDWGQVEPVDIVCGGYPCQPFSTAGLRKGIEDERHIWPNIADALRVLRPRFAIFENVAGHLRRGFDTVLADLARLGFDAGWCLVRASEVGAPHRRERLFLLAWPADTAGPGFPRPGVRGRSAERSAAAADAADIGHERGRRARDRRPGPAHGDLPTADTGRGGLHGHGELPAGRDPLQLGLRHDAPRCGTAPTPDTARVGRGEGRAEPARQQGRSDAALGGGAAAPDADSRGRGPAVHDLRTRQPDTQWGRFTPAIHRWEYTLGRPAPRATDHRGRLNPPFVEWMQGLPAGHVTAVPGLTRTAQLKALGNGVVPQQAEAAIRLLLARAEPAGVAV